MLKFDDTYIRQGAMIQMNHFMGDKELITIKPNKIKTNTQYFSHALKEMIGKIPQYPVTIVEAASGYGKTTCIRHFFSSLTDADVRWVSLSTDETAEKAIWKAFLFNNSKSLHIISLTHIINKESEFLYEYSVGWIAPRYLQLLYFEKMGIFRRMQPLTQ